MHGIQWWQAATTEHALPADGLKQLKGIQRSEVILQQPMQEHLMKQFYKIKY
jgi:hypothetical protein